MDGQRNLEVDVIRMVALMGICIVNVPFMALPVEAVFMVPDNAPDMLGAFIVEGLFQLKFFLLFSFIFGWGMAIQARTAEHSGQVFSERYFRRLVGLALIGVVHAVLVFSGDILLLYALLGVLLWLLRERSPRFLIYFAFSMIPVSLACLSVLAVVIDELLKSDMINMGLDGHHLAGSFGQATQGRLHEWPVTFLFLLFLQGPLALGAFSCGLAAAKTDFFVSGNDGFLALRSSLPLLLAIALPCNLLYAMTMSGVIPSSSEWLSFVGFIAIGLGAPALSATYLYLIIIASRRFSFPSLLLMAGRNSLSTYILQGVICGFVFSGYGLGLFNQYGLLALLPVSALIGILSILLVSGYVRLLGRGPLELVLRKISG
ncbi:MAG: DUF418 domain-containing protein [Nitrincola lacisaponensis]|uniref:DUF418 domain-containing protein n=1 Tax=Nitrincola lacisaponensis TaxID=267850 RepID=UPI00391C6DE8